MYLRDGEEVLMFGDLSFLVFRVAHEELTLFTFALWATLERSLVILSGVRTPFPWN